MTKYQVLKSLSMILVLFAVQVARANQEPRPSPSPSLKSTTTQSSAAAPASSADTSNPRPGDGSQPLKTDSFTDASKAGVADNASVSGAVLSDIAAMFDEMEEALETSKDLAEVQRQVRELKAALASVDVKIKSILEQIERVLRTEDEELNRIKGENENKERSNNLKQLVAKLTEIRPRLVALLEVEPETKIAVAWLIRISQDSAYATRLLTAARNSINNTSAFSQFLKNDITGTPIDVREIKDSNGFMIVVRIGKLTHCLSTKLQCGGKRYSVTN